MKHIFKKCDEKAETCEVFSVKKASIESQASGDGMTVKDKGNRKRRKLGREAKDLKRKISESGVLHVKMRRGKC